MEGWYFKLSLENGAQFAYMFSAQDLDVPGAGTPATHVGAQVMGPGDSYLCRMARGMDRAKRAGFRADARECSLSASLPGEGFFDSTPTAHRGALTDDGSTADLVGFGSIALACRWEYEVELVSGWGGDAPRATAGWLASLPVFEPHWQVMVSHGLARGWVEWDVPNQEGAVSTVRYDFDAAPFYAEKNWGGETFPERWFWAQCNAGWAEGNGAEDEGASDALAGLTLTAGGGRRALPLVPGGAAEDVAMIGVHMPGGEFLEWQPQAASVRWMVAPWGSWHFSGRSETHEIEIMATAEAKGSTLRAPTTRGLVPMCRDTFDGAVSLRIWALDAGGRRVGGSPMVDAKSNNCACEVGGGPWWEPWEGEARFGGGRIPKEGEDLAKAIVGLPFDMPALNALLPNGLRIPGL